MFKQKPQAIVLLLTAVVVVWLGEAGALEAQLPPERQHQRKLQAEEATVAEILAGRYDRLGVILRGRIGYLNAREKLNGVFRDDSSDKGLRLLIDRTYLPGTSPAGKEVVVKGLAMKYDIGYIVIVMKKIEIIDD